MQATPQKGIPAGCSFATFLVQVYCIEDLDIGASNVEVSLHMFINDLLLLFSHRCKKTVVSELKRAAASLLCAIQCELERFIDIDKSAVLASAFDIQKRLAKARRRYSGSVPHHAANLGVDFRAGQKRGR
eukprot:7828215-Pyramimonas_sp.AAC.1